MLAAPWLVLWEALAVPKDVRKFCKLTSVSQSLPEERGERPFRLQRSQGCVGLISGPDAFARQRSGPKGSGIKNILLFTTVLHCVEGKGHGQMCGHTITMPSQTDFKQEMS